MVERRELLDELRERLSGPDRLVTLSGPGGCGKTWLARLAAADLGRAFDHGARFVELGDLDDAALVVHTVGRGLGLQLAGGVGLRSLVEAVADRQVLAVLDRCEQVLEACAEVVAGLLRGCPNVRVLTTSRQPLRVTGEHVLPVPPLSYPPRDSEAAEPLSVGGYDAVALFVERATAATPTFRLTEDNAAAVAAVCAKLEGNPLAIELAAARANVLAPQAILDRLEDRYRLLTKGAPGAPGRQQSLRASVDASHELCNVSERTLWARVSVFAGSFDLDAAEAVCSGDGISEADVIDLVDSLLEKSVLVREDDGSQVRYRMHETLRAYGAERLGAEGRRRWGHRHLHWCEALVRTGAEEWFGPRQSAWRSRFEREHANLRAALDLATADPSTAAYALRISAGLESFWIITGRISEGRHWLALALRHRTGSPAERARALIVAAGLATLHSDLAQAEGLLAEARTLQAAGGSLVRALLARAEGGVAAWGGHHEEAERSYLDAVELALMADSAAAAAEAWFFLALNRAVAGRPDDAEEAVRHCLALTEQAQESQLRSYALGLLGLIALYRGDTVTAAVMARNALRLYAAAALEESVAVASLYELLAWIATVDGDPDRAATLIGAADRLARTLGVDPGASPPLSEGREERLAEVREALGDRTFERQVERGASMTVQGAIRYALEDVPEQRQSNEDTPLTARELEVAELVGRGMSNREVAAALRISARTAQGHVENILRKLRFGSRAQVAAWVAERRARRP